jgi:hypothetical protein
MDLGNVWRMLDAADPDQKTPAELGYGTQSIAMFVTDVDAWSGPRLSLPRGGDLLKFRLAGSIPTSTTHAQAFPRLCPDSALRLRACASARHMPQADAEEAAIAGWHAEKGMALQPCLGPI